MHTPPSHNPSSLLMFLFTFQHKKRDPFNTPALFHFSIHILAAIIHNIFICFSQGYKVWCWDLLLSFPFSHSLKTKQKIFFTDRTAPTKSNPGEMWVPALTKAGKTTAELFAGAVSFSGVTRPETIKHRQQTSQLVRDIYIIEKDLEGNSTGCGFPPATPHRHTQSCSHTKTDTHRLSHCWMYQIMISLLYHIVQGLTFSHNLFEYTFCYHPI